MWLLGNYIIFFLTFPEKFRPKKTSCRQRCAIQQMLEDCLAQTSHKGQEMMKSECKDMEENKRVAPFR